MSFVAVQPLRATRWRAAFAFQRAAYITYLATRPRTRVCGVLEAATSRPGMTVRRLVRIADENGCRPVFSFVPR